MAVNTLEVEVSANSLKSAKKPTRRDRKKRNATSKRDLLEILESLLIQMDEAGIGAGIVTLPKRILPSIGVILANVEACPKCNKLLPAGDECPRHS